MTIRYFQNIKNRDELRKAYLSLMKKYHPDCGGDTEISKQINAEYDHLSRILPASSANTEGQHSTRQSASRDIKIDSAIKDTLNKLFHMTGIKIEICGSWIWVDGNTFPWKDELKKAGFQWSKNRKKWHYTPYATGWYKGGKKTFEQIRAAYGSMVIDTPDVAAITA